MDDDAADTPEPLAQPHEFEDVSELLQRQLERVGGPFARISAAFARAAGPDLARVAVAASLKGTTLRVRCASASWAQSVSFMQRELLERLAAECPDVTITRISATGDGVPLPPQVEVPDPRAPQPGRPRELTPLDTETRDRLERLAAGIADPVVRASVLRAAERSVQHRRDTP